MKLRFFAVAGSLLLAYAVRGESVALRIQETVVIEILGATAAYTTNPDIADVSIAAKGHLSVTGHSGGTTQLMVVSASGTQSFLITVAAASIGSAIRPDASQPVARYEGRYSSGVERVQNEIDVVTNEGPRRSEFHILHVRNLRVAHHELFDGIASIFYRNIAPGRQLTLLDDIVDASRLTVNNTQVRGIHLTRGPLELHAGYASSTLFDDIFLPVDRRWVAGAGYSIDVGSTRLIPSVYGFFSGRAGTGARRGIVGALTAAHRKGETLFMRGEIAGSRSLAVAGDLRYTTLRNQVQSSFFFKPENFPTLGLADMRGAHAGFDATHLATDRLSLNSRGTYDRLEIAAQPQTIAAAAAGLKYSLTSHLTVLAGADLSSAHTPATSIRTIGIPAGALFETRGFGMAAAYRLLDHSGTTRHGDELRLSAHAGVGRFNASVWADRERQAPTLELIFREEPGLDLALLRLGITARSPEEVAAALRDNAALIDLGFITGVNVDLTPRRLQTGFNLGWLGSGERGNRLRLQGVYSRDDGIRTTRDSMIATLSYSRRLFGSTDVYGSYSWWRVTPATRGDANTAVDVGLRQQFNGVPEFLQRSGTIEGFAFLDPEMRGVRGKDSAPLADIEVTLDGARKARTDGKGAYAFHRVSPGPHQVAAQLPAEQHAFFTTPSHSETKAPARIDFGLVWAAARIDGVVISDARKGVADAIVSAVTHSGVPITATSDAEGRFVFSVPPGTFRVTLAAESLGAGYSIANAEQDVAVEPDRPASLKFLVQARRSIGGLAAGAKEVRIESLAMTAPVDAHGKFLFRLMPSGTFTLSAISRGRLVTQTVTLPAEPATIGNVVLGAPGAVATTDRDAAPMRATAPPPAIVATPALVVQTGAFRQQRNARELVERLRRSGEHPFTVAKNRLTFVYVGPFPTRAETVAASKRLRRAGFETFVASR